MFLSRLAEKSGLFGILAPHRNKSPPKVPCAEGDDEVVDKAKLNGNTQEKATLKKNERNKQSQPLNDGQESTVRKRRLDAQRKLEEDAESRGAFAKKQRVKYHNKLHGRWDDAVIVGVHYDDGPDKPYYVSLPERRRRSPLGNMLSLTLTIYCSSLR